MTALGYRRYLLSILVVVLAANYMDGLALGLVLQNIKTDLHLSDTQLGLLSGFAFALFYSVAGIPIARWADRGNRVTIISACVLAWSAMVALCGLASSFAQLLLIRVGVGVGEAGCVPPAHSLIADYYSRAERPRAVAIFLQGNSLSLVFGYFVAGWLNELYGWRATFLMLGLPGLALAALVRFTLREPRAASSIGLKSNSVERQDGEPSASPPSAVTLWEACKTLWTNRTFRHLLFSFSVVYFFGTGIAQWQPAFFARSYGMRSGELGTWFAAIYGLGGMIGMYWGGAWATRFAGGDERRQLRAMAIAYVLYGLLSTCIYLSPNQFVAFGLMAAGTIIGSTTSAPLFATIQTLVPSHMRAVSIALVYLFANLIGLGLGPVVTGVLSDALRPLFGEESLRYSLLVLCPGFLWVAWHLWRASQSVSRDVEAAQALA